MKAYKYKLKSSRKIVTIFESWLAVLCELYNAAIQERRDAYRINGISIGKKDQQAQLPEIKKDRRGVAARRISRRKKFSKRWKKAVRLAGRKHQKIARKRRDHHFKEAKKLVVRFRVIKFEDLNVIGLMKNRHLAKSIGDAGWSQFISITAHKAEEAPRAS